MTHQQDRSDEIFQVLAGSSHLDSGLGPGPRRLKEGGKGILYTCYILNRSENLELVSAQLQTKWLQI